VAGVVTGFEPVDLLEEVFVLPCAAERGESRVENAPTPRARRGKTLAPGPDRRVFERWIRMALALGCPGQRFCAMRPPYERSMPISCKRPFSWNPSSLLAASTSLQSARRVLQGLEPPKTALPSGWRPPQNRPPGTALGTE